jgi:hypothetical protein
MARMMAPAAFLSVSTLLFASPPMDPPEPTRYNAQVAESGIVTNEPAAELRNFLGTQKEP